MILYRQRVDAPTILALTCYAALAAIVLVTVRAGVGALDLPSVPFAQTGIARPLQDSSLGFYDKSELRLAIAELTLWTAGLAVALVLCAHAWLRRRSAALILWPTTAAFALILYFSVLRLPPYNEPLATAATAMLAQLIAGIAMFALLHGLTASRAAALLVASWLVLEAPALERPVAAAAIALGGLLVYSMLRKASGRARTMFVALSILSMLAGVLLTDVGPARDLAYWIGAPAVAAAGVDVIRAASSRSWFRLPASAVLCALFLIAFPIGRLNKAIGAYTTQYEPGRAQWYHACFRGGPCDPERKPSLRTALRQSGAVPP